MKILRSAFIGLLAGFLLSLLADRSIWLEMRVNTGLLLPLTMAIAVVAGIFSERRIPAPLILGLEIVLILLLLAVYGFDLQALLVIPASAFKEGFFLQAWDGRTVNGLLAVLFLLGNGAVFISPASSRR